MRAHEAVVKVNFGKTIFSFLLLEVWCRLSLSLDTILAPVSIWKMSEVVLFDFPFRRYLRVRELPRVSYPVLLLPRHPYLAIHILTSIFIFYGTYGHFSNYGTVPVATYFLAGL